MVHWLHHKIYKIQLCWFTVIVFTVLNLLKPAGHVMQQQFNIQQLYSLSALFMCFVFIWEQTATCATYSINWSVFITEMKSVYCAVRTGPSNKAVCASYLNGWNIPSTYHIAIAKTIQYRRRIRDGLHRIDINAVKYIFFFANSEVVLHGHDKQREDCVYCS